MSIGQNVRPAPKSRNLSCRASCGKLECAFSEPVKAEKYLEKTTWAEGKLGIGEDLTIRSTLWLFNIAMV